MLGAMDIAEWLHAAEDGLYGDLEAFMESCTSGKQSASWSLLEARNAVESEAKIRSMQGSCLVPGCV